VTSLAISLADLMTVLTACKAVRSADCAPESLRAYLLDRLADPYPRLAAAVRAFDPTQMVALAHYVLDGLELAEGPPTASRA
jgi:hypothetical protein